MPRPVLMYLILPIIFVFINVKFATNFNTYIKGAVYLNTCPYFLENRFGDQLQKSSVSVKFKTKTIIKLLRLENSGIKF